MVMKRSAADAQRRAVAIRRDAIAGATREKQCLRCRRYKPAGAFRLHHKRRDGRFPYCDPCRRSAEYARSRRGAANARLADEATQPSSFVAGVASGGSLS